MLTEKGLTTFAKRKRRYFGGSQLFPLPFDSVYHHVRGLHYGILISRKRGDLQMQVAPTCDLSDQRLQFLPDQLFSVGVDRHIISLNLRRNSLQMRPGSEVSP